MILPGRIRYLQKHKDQWPKKVIGSYYCSPQDQKAWDILMYPGGLLLQTQDIDNYVTLSCLVCDQIEFARFSLPTLACIENGIDRIVL